MNTLVRTELRKQRTTPALVAGAALVPALAALVAVAICSLSGKEGNPPLDAGSLAQIVGGPADGVTLVVALLGVLAMTGEYRHQTITTTFLATPRRRHVVVAKLGAGALAGLGLGLTSVAVSFAVGVPWLASAGVDVAVDGEVLRVAAGLVTSLALHGALGVAVGSLVRNQTAAVAALLAWVLGVEPLLRDLLDADSFVRWLPGGAARAIVHAGAGGPALSPAAGAALLTAWVAALAVAGTRLTVQRDIT